MFDVAIVRHGTVKRLVVSGDLDLATAPRLQAKYDALRPSASVVLDLTAITFIDSTGLQAILYAREMFGDRLRIVANDAARHFFETTGVLDVLPLAD